MQPILSLFLSILCMFHAGAPAGEPARLREGRPIVAERGTRPCDLVRLPPALAALKELRPRNLIRRACPALSRLEVADDLKSAKWRCRF